MCYQIYKIKSIDSGELVKPLFPAETIIKQQHCSFDNGFDESNDESPFQTFDHIEVHYAVI